MVPLDNVLSLHGHESSRWLALVQQYASDMRGGDIFPPISLYPGDPFLVGDGNHRVAAARLNGANAIHAVIDYRCAFSTVRCSSCGGMPTWHTGTFHGTVPIATCDACYCDAATVLVHEAGFQRMERA